MTRTPRTEDAWRDAIKSPKAETELEPMMWKRVARTMYDAMQRLEDELGETGDGHSLAEWRGFSASFAAEVEDLQEEVRSLEAESYRLEAELTKLRGLLK